MLQDIEAQDDDLELTLKMALEPDLRLRFFDAAQFSTWKQGFETLQQLLFSPGWASCRTYLLTCNGWCVTAEGTGATQVLFCPEQVL